MTLCPKTKSGEHHPFRWRTGRVTCLACGAPPETRSREVIYLNPPPPLPAAKQRS